MCNINSEKKKSKLDWNSYQLMDYLLDKDINMNGGKKECLVMWLQVWYLLK